MKTMKTFKIIGSLFDANGGAEKDVNNRVKTAWSKWRETTVVTCDRNIYGAPFSHLFTELKISPIEVHRSAIQLEISPIQLKISPNQLEISTNRPI